MRKATQTLRPVPRGTPESRPSPLPCGRQRSRRTRCTRGGAGAKEELRKGGAWVKKMHLNEETLFGARGRDKQRPAGRRGDLPGTRAGTTKGDKRSGIRKQAEAEASRDREVPDTRERKRSRRRGSRGLAVTCTRRLTFCRAGSSARLRSAGTGTVAGAAVQAAGSRRFGYRSRVLPAAGSRKLARLARPSSFPAERLVHCLSSAACMGPPSGPHL